jgi:hypothetical protein
MADELVNYDFEHGRKSSISTTAVQLTSVDFTCRRGVLVKAAAGNSGKVYVGKSDATNDSADATDGFELSAGESVVIEVDKPNKVYVIGSAASQKVFWVTV